MFKRFRIRKKIALIVAVAGILFAPSPSFSLNYIPAIHVGSFRGVLDEGRISILARTDNTAVAIIFNQTYGYGDVNENITINGDGTFSFATSQGMIFSGKFEVLPAPSAYGTYIDEFGFEGQFFSDPVPRQGQFQNIAGYYKGSVTGTLWNNGDPLPASASGENFWFLTSEGSSGYAYFYVSADSKRAEGGGGVTISLGTNNNADINGTALSEGSTIYGEFDASTLSGNGDIPDLLQVEQLGTWSAVQIHPMPNRLPIAKDDRYIVIPGERLVIQQPESTVLSNDIDGDNDTLTAKLISETMHGTLVLAAQTGSFSYTPNLGFIGKDSFTYKAFDGFGDSNLATVILQVGQSLPWLPLLLE